MANKKNERTLSLFKKSNQLIVVLVSLLIGIVGTYALTSGHATPYPGYFFPNADNKYTSSPYNPSYMGDTVTFRAHYGKSTKSPSAKVTCWHVDVTPSYTYWDHGDSILESKAKATTSPIFTKTFSPSPASDQEVKIALGTNGTGPATCESQFFEGATLKSTVSFRSL